MHIIFSALLFLFIFVRRSLSQTTAAFTDPLTGITFQRFFGARTQFGFGIALPENPTTDFIGQMSFPTPNGAGWGGISLTDDMVGPLLLAAWPSGNTVVSSFRIARNEDDSPPVATGTFTVVPIPQGTVSDGTSMTFTFLCQGCIDSKLGFAAGNTLGNFNMGWALSSISVSDPANGAAELPFHNSGFDEFEAQFNLARNPLFGEWALLAGATSNGSTTPVVAAPPGTGGNVGGGDDIDDEDDNDDSGDESD